MSWTPGRISLLVPSRGRPTHCLAMWRSARSTADHTGGDLELVLYLDDDDPLTDEYQDWIDQEWPTQVRYRLGPRILLSETWNRCLERATGEVLWHGNDDVLFRSIGWDTAVRQAVARYPDGIVLVHGRDGIHDAAMATLGFLHRRWVETVGYLVPPYFSSDYNDTWNSEVADRLGRRVYLPQVYTEHLHPAAGKAPLDLTHRERLYRHRQDNVDALYASLAPERSAWVERLRAVILEAAG